MFPEVLKNDLTYSDWDNLQKQIRKKKNGESTLEIYGEPLLTGFSAGDMITVLIEKFVTTVPEATVVGDYSIVYSNSSEAEQIHYEFKDQKLTVTSLYSDAGFLGYDECDGCGEFLSEEFAYYYYVPGQGIVCPECGEIILPEEAMEVSKEVEEMKDGVFP